MNTYDIMDYAMICGIVTAFVYALILYYIEPTKLIGPSIFVLIGSMMIIAIYIAKTNERKNKID